MKKIFLSMSFYVLCFAQQLAFAQITVTFPMERAVFQRNNSNEANVYIGGFTTEPFQRIEARFVPHIAGEGEASPASGEWTIIDNTLSSGHFYGSMPVKGGWYRLEVRGIRQGSEPKQTNVERVGVGEVFLVAGQSNATGGDANPNGPGAMHDQVNSVNFQNVSGGSVIEYDNVQLPCPDFVHLDASVKTAPFGNYAWCWGAFGDKIYEKLRVPVMIFNAGWSSTGIEEWRQSIDPNAVTTGPFGYTFPRGLPFGHLRLALNNYIAQLGIRAVIWHQGETDNFIESSLSVNPKDRYRDKLWEVISASRNLSGKSNLAWVVARASRFTFDGASRVSSNVIAAQNELIDNDGIYADVFQGPETDPYYSIDYRADEVHFRGDGVTTSPDGHVYSGLIALAGFWNDKITNDFLAQSTPYPALAPAEVTAAQAPGSTNLTFTGPAMQSGAQCFWLTADNCNQVQSMSPQWTVGTGSYKLKIVDAYKNTIFSPTLYVSGTSLPVVWKYFHIREMENSRPLLEWATSEETNASHYELERGNDAIHFTNIKNVAAAGNSTATHQYAYPEEFLPSGTYYYRIKQVDLDGKFDYTRVISTKIEANNALSVFPNPVTDLLNIESDKVLGSVEVANSAGTKLFFSKQNANAMKLDMHIFPTGLYMISANGKHYKVIKK
ncbi:T9SS type A sorting domain-containing protein [Dyadobacter sp. CY326]|uniref:T9SS type A sorting domain-containing protein n=1 Tax=Dyadobacter sp. CY326 TaxID=2907300 RepID=UPI001F472947|nr:T9SS type A sorting domain-containing protein [Dyadobacter sp. CY326]MCE7063788.1 T9SS type A sorting domain-containing protein [Dyadobacter sp. CY326]